MRYLIKMVTLLVTLLLHQLQVGIASIFRDICMVGILLMIMQEYAARQVIEIMNGLDQADGERMILYISQSLLLRSLIWMLTIQRTVSGFIRQVLIKLTVPFNSRFQDFWPVKKFNFYKKR